MSSGFFLGGEKGGSSASFQVVFRNFGLFGGFYDLADTSINRFCHGFFRVPEQAAGVVDVLDLTRGFGSDVPELKFSDTACCTEVTFALAPPTAVKGQRLPGGQIMTPASAVTSPSWKRPASSRASRSYAALLAWCRRRLAGASLPIPWIG